MIGPLLTVLHVTRSRTTLAAAVGVALLVSAACGGGDREEALPSAAAEPTPTTSADAPAATPTTTTPPAPTTTAAPNAEQRIVDLGPSVLTLNYPPDLDPALRPAIDQYFRFQTAVVRAGVTPDPTDPEIAASTTPAAGKALRDRVANDLATGERAYGVGHLNPRVAAATNESVQIEDCLLDGFSAVNGRGEIISPASTSRKLYFAELVHRDGVWKVGTSYPIGGPCEL